MNRTAGIPHRPIEIHDESEGPIVPPEYRVNRIFHESLSARSVPPQKAAEAGRLRVETGWFNGILQFPLPWCRKMQNRLTSAREPAMVACFMNDTNLAYWGMIVVPLGVAICFGPALLVWLREELGPDASKIDKPETKP